MAGYIDTSELIPHAVANVIPDNYQTEHANPNTFGASIGQAEERSGQELGQTASFFQQVQADDSVNQLLDYDTKLKYGDPKNPQDQGYFGLKGADALSQRAAYAQKYDDFIAQKRAQLGSPFAQFQFDQMSRRYRSFFLSQMGAHADQQAQLFTNETNKATSDLSLNAISAASNTSQPDQQIIDFHTNQMVAAAEKQAQLQGAKGPDDPISQALVGKAKQQALKAQILSMASSPEGAARAQAFLEQNKGAAGDLYPALNAHVKAQASQFVVDQGVADAQHQAVGDVHSGNHGYLPGIPVKLPDMQNAILGQESGNRSNIGSSINGAMGPGQIMPATFAAYAKPGESISNPADNRAVNARILQDYISRYNGDPARVAVAYFSGPGNVSPMADKTPWKTDSKDGNGKSTSSYVADVLARLGRPAPPAGQNGIFPTVASTSPLLAQYGMSPLAAPAETPSIPVGPSEGTTESGAPPTPQPQPVVYQEISPAGMQPMTGAMNAMNVAARAMQIWGARTDITPEQRETGFIRLRQNLQQAQFAAESTQQSIKEQSNASAKGYIPRIVSGDASAIADIAKDPNLEFPTQMELLRFAKERGIEGAGMGSNYNDALKRIALPMGDPNRISNYSQLLQMRNNGQLSDAGLSKVGADMEKVKSQDFQGVVTAKSAALDQVKNYMTYGEEGNFPGALKDPKGKAAYDKFVVAFEADFDQWVNQGKNPFDFLKDDKGIKAIADSIRSPEQKRLDQITESVGNEAQAYNPAAEQAPVPAPPAKVDPDTWSKVIDMRPSMQTNQGPQKLRKDAWGNFLTSLLTKPPEVQQTVLQSFAQRFPGSDLAGPFSILLNAVQGAKAAPPSRPVTPTPGGSGVLELPTFDIRGVQPGQPMPGMAVSP